MYNKYFNYVILYIFKNIGVDTNSIQPDIPI